MTTEKTQEKSTPKGKPTFWITGRIRSTRQVGVGKDNFPIIENVINTPAPDSYSHPDRFCVMTRSKIGNEGDDIAIEVAPHCRSYQATDKNNNKFTRYTHDLWAVQ